MLLREGGTGKEYDEEEGIHSVLPVIPQREMNSMTSISISTMSIEWRRKMSLPSDKTISSSTTWVLLPTQLQERTIRPLVVSPLMWRWHLKHRRNEDRKWFVASKDCSISSTCWRDGRGNRLTLPERVGQSVWQWCWTWVSLSKSSSSFWIAVFPVDYESLSTLLEWVTIRIVWTDLKMGRCNASTRRSIRSTG